MKKEENISDTPLAKSFQLVNSLSDLEQGRFYKVNKDGSFVKKNDGIDSIPAKDLADTLNTSSVENKVITKIKNFVFSTYGLVIILLLIVITGITLGLIPVFLNKSNKTNILVITTNPIPTGDKNLVSTESPTVLSTILTTLPSTVPSTQPQDIETTVETTTSTTTTPATTIQTTLEEKTQPITTPTIPETTVQETTVFTTEYTTEKMILTTEKLCEIDPNPKSIIPIDYNLNSCPTRSIYSPKFLSLTDSYSFEYPINQIIVCPESKLELKCPNNQVLHIYSAYYGIQPDTNTFTCDKKSSFHEICYFDLTFSNLTTSCEQKSSCEITVNVGSFGDPCINSKNKQLFVQYQCIDDTKYSLVSNCNLNTNKSSICPEIKSGQFQNYYCNSDPFTLSCTEGKKIKILCAFYGLDPNLRCPGTFYYGAPSACYSKQSYDLIFENCDGKSNCTFSDDTHTKYDIGFNEVCPGYLNMLLIQWECVADAITTLSQDTTAKTLPICKTIPSINGTCNTAYSHFVPQLLTNSTQSYFSYPIYQQIVCQGSTLVIVCPADMAIHIYAGYFGLQQYTKSTICLANPDDETPYMFYLADSFRIINSTCEYKNKCALRAFPITLGGPDLNSAYYKQLVVQYQCVDPIVLKNEINKCERNTQIPEICPKIENGTQITFETTVCDGNPMKISCTGTRRIKVLCAFYGIHPSLTSCEIPSLSYKPVCYFESSTSKIIRECDSLASCSINVVGTSEFGLDPCNGLKKALYIQWRCV